MTSHPEADGVVTDRQIRVWLISAPCCYTLVKAFDVHAPVREKNTS